MILTVTLNPAMDVYLRVPAFKSGRINRASRVQAEPGGKGVNIGSALQRLGHEVAALGFVGGPTGLLVEERLRDTGLATGFVHVDGETRIDYILMDEQVGSVTQVFESGPTVGRSDLDALTERMGRLLGRAEAVVIAGSLPPGATPEWYREIVHLASERGVRVVLNVRGDIMEAAVEQPVWIAKPDVRVRHEFMGASMNTEEGRTAALRRLRDVAEIAIVAVGFEASLASYDEAFRASAAGCQPACGVRTDDSLLAGVIDTVLRGGTLSAAARRGMATALAASCVLGERLDSADAVTAREADVEVVPLGL